MLPLEAFRPPVVVTVQQQAREGSSARDIWQVGLCVVTVGHQHCIKHLGMHMIMLLGV